METTRPKVTDPVKYLQHVLAMLHVAAMLKDWDVQTGQELEANIVNDPLLSAGRRHIFAGFIGALNAAAGHRSQFEALDHALSNAFRERFGVGPS